MPLFKLEIIGDPTTGGVQASGPIDNMLLMRWLCGEALRIAEKRADQREAERGNGSGLIVARQLPDLPHL